jgi:hypothetical protein
MVRKAVGAFVTAADAIALIGTWMRFAPVATEAPTAAGIEPSAGTSSLPERASGIRKEPLSTYSESDLQVLAGDQSAGK